MLKNLISKYFKDVIDDNPKIVDEINTIFEAAVSEGISEKLKKKEDDFEVSNNENLTAFKEEVVENLDNYISLSMEEFVEEKKSDIASAMKVSLAEKTLSIVKTLFTEAGVEIPENRVDVILNLENKIKDMSEKLNERINDDINSKKQIFEYKKSIKFIEMTDGYSDTKKEKLMTLIENIECEDIQDFEKKVNILKESLLDKKVEKEKKENLNEDFDDDELDKYLP